MMQPEKTNKKIENKSETLSDVNTYFLDVLKTCMLLKIMHNFLYWNIINSVLGRFIQKLHLNSQYIASSTPPFSALDKTIQTDQFLIINLWI